MMAFEASVSLNDRQLEAVQTTEGYVRVIASAGSGKTRAISQRFGYLVNDLGILPSSILCVSFTNKSANEMRNRIHQLIGDDDAGFITTFHGFCNTILLEDSHAVNYPKSFMVIDNGDIDAILGLVYEERNLSLKDKTFSQARDMIEIQKLFDKPEYHRDLTGLSLEDLYRKYQNAKESDDIIFYGYLYHQKKGFLLDYNDLIILTLQIFKNHPDILLKWQQRLEYIMVDEFQDIDGLQYELMEQLAGYHKNLFVVGDPDQTIYTWRGARVSYLLDFDSNFKETKTIFLNENYRSTPEILDACNALISKNTRRLEKNMVTANPSGPVVRAMHFENAAREAESLALLVENLQKKGYALKDITILYRAHYMSRTLEDAFIARQIPYSIYSGIPFFQRMEIKDALSYLRMLVYRDDLDFLRTINTPKRNIGKSRIRFLKEYALEHQTTLYEALKSNLNEKILASTKAGEYVELIETFQWEHKLISQVLAEMLDLSGYEKMLRIQGSQERLDNLAELKQSVMEYEQSAGEDIFLQEYLSKLSLMSAQDQNMQSDKVKMMTIHTAKGLEFPVVILVGMSEGMFPSRKTKDFEGMEEERRLAFVAMSRARERLYLSEAAGMSINSMARYPSRFLLDISCDHMVWDPKPDPELLMQTQMSIQTKTRYLPKTGNTGFRQGDRVEHKVFGKGTILQVDSEKLTCLVHFDTLDTQRKLSYKAGLKKLEGEDRDPWLH